nr:molybdenum cofactor biosynthesis protein MoaE [uncultured Carboxylicivirga sp.]
MYITDKEINIGQIFSEAHSELSGAIVLFSGEVRGINHGQKVEYLEYEAYAPMAEEVFDQILTDAKNKWRLNYANGIHRTGRLNLTECAVVIVTASAHRGDAYAANRYIIDRVKAEVPIWKKEVYTDGTHTWGSNCECNHHTHQSFIHQTNENAYE